MKRNLGASTPYQLMPIIDYKHQIPNSINLLLSITGVPSMPYRGKIWKKAPDSFFADESSEKMGRGINFSKYLVWTL